MLATAAGRLCHLPQDWPLMITFCRALWRSYEKIILLKGLQCTVHSCLSRHAKTRQAHLNQIGKAEPKLHISSELLIHPRLLLCTHIPVHVTSSSSWPPAASCIGQRRVPEQCMRAVASNRSCS